MQPTRGIFGCVCAEAASGQTKVAPPTSVMNSRRRMSPPIYANARVSDVPPSTKAFAALRCAKQRDVGCGSEPAVAAASQVPFWRVRFSPDTCRGCRGSADVRSVPNLALSECNKVREQRMQLLGQPHQYLRIAPAGGEAEHSAGLGFTGSPEKLQEMLRRSE